MFSQILVPTDFSKKHATPLEIAVNLAAKHNSTIHLLHVVEIIADTTFTEYEDFYNRLERKAQKQMNNLMAQYEKKSVQILPHISYGNRVQEILKFRKDHEIDLIIMNSHKVELKNPIQSWGTISYKVALLSDSPVLLVK
ncbi:MAG: universal stress protein [Syntrophales bacterium]|jgi:nucleotide-binding universal stress UspA family protein|nr:universal stress protein [Syntrophales bacterium]NLN59961.1 universal stress protein [Deltaproteobacteria bacterium]